MSRPQQSQCLWSGRNFGATRNATPRSVTALEPAKCKNPNPRRLALEKDDDGPLMPFGDKSAFFLAQLEYEPNVPTDFL